jgi:hypothetical protein
MKMPSLITPIKIFSSARNLSRFETKPTQVATFSKSQLQRKFSAAISWTNKKYVNETRNSNANNVKDRHCTRSWGSCIHLLTPHPVFTVNMYVVISTWCHVRRSWSPCRCSIPCKNCIFLTPWNRVMLQNPIIFWVRAKNSPSVTKLVQSLPSPKRQLTEPCPEPELSSS